MTKEEFELKYKDYPSRDEMTEEQERQFVEDSFACCEQEGFAKTFWSPYSDRSKYIGKPFSVIGRMYDGDSGVDLECLPLWNIRFEDGFESVAYPEEIVPSDMRSNGCPEEYLPAAGSTNNEVRGS